MAKKAKKKARSLETYDVPRWQVAVDWTPVSIYSTFMRSAADELVTGMRDRYPGIDWTVEERSRSIREEPYVEHTYHLVVPKWQVAQGKRVIKAYTRGHGR